MAAPPRTPEPLQRVFKKSDSDPQRGASPRAVAEWAPSYAAQAPFNNVTQTEAGHLMEMDDTPGAERLHFYHRSGSHIEFRPDGSVKYCSKQSRQDVTIADQEIIVNGNYTLSIAGNANIRVREGELEIQADSGAAINVKGQLKMSADEINLRARDKIVLASPAVDIGGVGPNASIPLLSLPFGLVPVFGLLVPRITVPSPASVIKDSQVSTEGLSGGVGVFNVVSKVTSAIKAVTKISSEITKIQKYASQVSAGVGLAKSLVDSKGDPLVAEVPQPEELPVSNPFVYNGLTDQTRAYRDRQFDSPADVDDSATYATHLNLCEEIGDFTGDIKDLPGEPNLDYVDTENPTDEPPPKTAYVDRGRVTFTRGQKVVTGQGTTFTKDYKAGTYLSFNDAPFLNAESFTEFPRIASIESDTSLVLAVEYSYPTAELVIPRSFRYRPFSEYTDRETFSPDELLGASGVRLGEFLTNFIPPAFEQDEIPTIIDTVVPPQPGSGPTPGTGWGSSPPPLISPDVPLF